MVLGCVDYQSGAIVTNHQTRFVFEMHRTSLLERSGWPTLIYLGVEQSSVEGLHAGQLGPPKRHDQAACDYKGPADIYGLAGGLVKLQLGYDLGYEEEEHYIDAQ